MSGSDRFLAAFNRIEMWLEAQSGSRRSVPFYRLVEQARGRNALVRRFEGDLKKFGDLRNCIVHEEVRPGYVIAEPHADVVEKIEWILGELTEPELVMPRFARDVVVLSVGQPIGDALAVVREREYSYFPVYDGEAFVGLLTGSGMARWLARRVEGDAILLGGAFVGDVLAVDEHRDAYDFVGRDATVVEVRERFARGVEAGEAELAALLITHGGRRSEALLGIITGWDMRFL